MRRGAGRSSGYPPRTMQRTLLAIFLAFTASGCFISRTAENDPLSTEALQTLTPGTSTATEVLDALGAPNDVVQLGRESAWLYDYTMRKRAGMFLLVVGLLNEDTRQDRIWVFFDEDNVLQHAGSTLNAEEAVYAMPWVDRD